jgi:sugar O-acyltransferase (sialic acid O-acetyltransferase NeuD family)
VKFSISKLTAGNSFMKKILIIGSSGHAKVICDIVEKEGLYVIIGFLDNFREPGEEVFGYRVLGKLDDLPELSSQYDVSDGIIAIGDNFNRYKVYKEISQTLPGFSFISTVHPGANIARDVDIDIGTVIMAGVSINPGCRTGKFCILNTNSSLDHDSVMGDFSSMAPNVSTGGNVSIGSFSAIGIGASIIHGVSIGSHTVIGAGAVVLKDVNSYKVAYGSPAREIRNRKEDDKYLG